MPPDDAPTREVQDPGSRTLPIALVGLLAVVVADLITGGTTLTILAVALLVVVAFALVRAQQKLAHTARALVAERDAERTARRRADLVAAVSELLESMLEPQVMVERLTDLFVPQLADVAVLDLLQRDGTLRGAVTAAVDPAIADDLRRLREEHPLDLESNHPVADGAAHARARAAAGRCPPRSAATPTAPSTSRTCSAPATSRRSCCR